MAAAMANHCDRVAVVLLHVAGRGRPVPAQAVGRSAGKVVLHQRQRQQVEARLAGEGSDIEILPDRAAVRSGELEQARRCRGDDAGDAHDSGGSLDRRQRGAVGEVPGDPAALDQDRRPGPLKSERRDDEKADLAVHLPVVEKDRALAEPATLHGDSAEVLRHGACRRARKRRGVEGRLGRSLLDARLECVLLRRAIELPLAESHAERDHRDGRNQDQHSAPAPARC